MKSKNTPLNFITNDMIRDAIDAALETKYAVEGSAVSVCTNQFDAHSIEQQLLKLYSEAFALELLQHKSAAYPLQSFSMMLGKRLADHASAFGIVKVVRDKSQSFAGTQIENQIWEKL